MYYGLSIMKWRLTPKLACRKAEKAIKSLRLCYYKLVLSLRPIPIVGVTGSVGKTTTCRMLASILTSAGKRVAFCTTQGVWLGDTRVRVGDSAHIHHALPVLIDRRSDAGVIEMARGGLLSHGVGVESIDVGVVLNIHDNHLGLGGVKTREEMACVKQSVAKAASMMAILNADDPLCLTMMELVSAKKLCLVSVFQSNPALVMHQQSGGTVATLDSSAEAPILQLFEGDRLVGSLPATEIPATLGGRYRPAIINALNAMAAGYGMGVDFANIQKGLSCFSSSLVNNPGRMNFIDGLPYKLCVTWGEGAEVFQEFANFFRAEPISGRRTLVVAPLGNRHDNFTLGMASEVATAFDQFVCTDWEDLRSRQPGEAAELFAQGLKACGISEEWITVIPAHADAVDYALASASPGDLLVIVTLGSEKVGRIARQMCEITDLAS